MPSRSNRTWVRVLYDLLDTGEPVLVEELMEQAGRLIPPGVAWRSREKGRYLANRSKGIGTPERKVDNVAIMSGARRLVRLEIGKIKYRGAGHYLDIDGKRYFQKTALKGDALIAAKSDAGRQYWNTLSDDERSEIIRRRWESIPPEKRTERTLKGWETRRSTKPSKTP